VIYVCYDAEIPYVVQITHYYLLVLSVFEGAALHACLSLSQLSHNCGRASIAPANDFSADHISDPAAAIRIWEKGFSSHSKRGGNSFVRAADSTSAQLQKAEVGQLTNRITDTVVY
jgi:hypothetical protein